MVFPQDKINDTGEEGQKALHVPDSGSASKDRISYSLVICLMSCFTEY